MAKMIMEANTLTLGETISMGELHEALNEAFKEAVVKRGDHVLTITPVTTPAPAEVADLLEKVADRFQSGTFNWRQGALGRDGTYCTVGGLALVATGNAQHFQNALVQAASVAIGRHLGSGAISPWASHSTQSGNVANWNDAEGRTVDQVIEALKGAAKDLRNEA